MPTNSSPSNWLTWLLAVLLLLCPSVQGTYFYLQEGKPKCFLRDVPAGTEVSVDYNSMDYDTVIRQPGQGTPTATVMMTVTNPQQVEQQRHYIEKTGRVSFTSQQSGDHQVCFLVTRQYFAAQQKQQLRLSITMGEGTAAIDYSGIAKQEHLSAIEVETRKLVDRVSKIRQDQDYMRKREEAFRNISESANSRVAYFNILIAIFLISGGVFQSMWLKQHFTSKKLI